MLSDKHARNLLCRREPLDLRPRMRRFVWPLSTWWTTSLPGKLWGRAGIRICNEFKLMITVSDAVLLSKARSRACDAAHARQSKESKVHTLSVHLFVCHAVRCVSVCPIARLSVLLAFAQPRGCLYVLFICLPVLAFIPIPVCKVGQTHTQTHSKATLCHVYS